MQHHDLERFLVPGHGGFCNALRRTILSDIQTEAPVSVTIKKNVTSHTDEFIAHRIGLIPFKRTGNGNTISLHATGSCVVTSDLFTGPSFESIHSNIELVVLGKGHELHIEVKFDSQPSGKHSRYSPCYAVGMKPAERSDSFIISFGSNDHRSPKLLLCEAFDCLERRIEKALLSLADDSICESFI